jgi:hypothetical protein
MASCNEGWRKSIHPLAWGVRACASDGLTTEMPEICDSCEAEVYQLGLPMVEPNGMLTSLQSSCVSAALLRPTKAFPDRGSAATDAPMSFDDD